MIDPERVEWSDDDPQPDGSASTEQVEYGEAQHSILTPEGQIETYGALARRIGARRLRGLIAVLFGIAIVALVVEVLG